VDVDVSDDSVHEAVTLPCPSNCSTPAASRLPVIDELESVTPLALKFHKPDSVLVAQATGCMLPPPSYA
jgi:hypothetical protein